ncbi:MAG: uncharacterized protein AUK63_1583 [bacterium P3]|nr:MAG: uncharacterized protein AUK63_1583 [bacterium P3]KWW40943.1 MAG: uncharacterized protein F083_1287 [bacterium F083]
MNYADTIAAALGLGVRQVAQTIQLLDQGATIPFIARYRKEATGSLDEVQIAAIRDHLLRLRELDARRQYILDTIRAQGGLTPELEQQILQAGSATLLEDLYLPFKPRRRTYASIAVERGLQPLADALMLQADGDVAALAAPYVDAGREVPTVDDALQGARHILAERVSEDATARGRIRGLFRRKALLTSKVVQSKAGQAAKYESWFQWSEPALRAPSHRVLAIFRGAAEGLLRLHLLPASDDEALGLLHRQFVRARNAAADQVAMAVDDAYRRLLAPSLETELYRHVKERADREAIRIFSANLRQLLLESPLGRRRVMAIDPGFRTGCKVVCLDDRGGLLHFDTVHPFTSVREERAAVERLEALAAEYDVEAVAIGNGTAGRETEELVRRCRFRSAPVIVMVSESGASVYSASDVARREFPDHDITVRGAVSIGRRLMDPLAELVKIDPRSIGVGQYQHDVDQRLLHDSLHDTVVSCVNSVGVELNTASPELLSYVSGIGAALADRIVAYRAEEGPFLSRRDLLKVPRLGPKVYEQCAGFLRVADSANPLDRSAVHPERYPLVERIAADLGCSVRQLVDDRSLRARIDLRRYCTADCGLPTLHDILAELDKPGRDPRSEFEIFEFDKNVNCLEDLRPGMILPGIVTNLTAFGAFVDIGVHHDGLIHISRLSARRVADPGQVLSLHQRVQVQVLEIDLRRQRISLSLLAPGTSPDNPR